MDSPDNLLKPMYERTSSNVAIVDSDIQLTYGELHQRIAMFADNLERNGVSFGSHVVVITEKRHEVIVAIFAIWSLGAVYIPIDADSPAGRIERLLRSARPTIVLSPKRFRCGKTPGDEFRTLQFEDLNFGCVTHRTSSIDNRAAQESNLTCNSSGTAYIFYTSGSTGEPKGVVISRKSLIAYLWSHNEILNFDNRSVSLNLAPFHFDVCMQDTVLPLIRGGTVVICTDSILGPLIPHHIEAYRITHLVIVSSLLILATGNGKRLQKIDLSSLEIINVGAEVCDPKIILLWKEYANNASVYNAYGPTECNSVSITYKVEESQILSSEYFPIGRPLSSVDVVLLSDDEDVIDEADQEGELLLGGCQLMEGYWQDANLTASVITNIDGKIYYKTGDRCRYDHSKNLVYLGRDDDQIKISGRRINMLEVRKVLVDSGLVVNAFVGVINCNNRVQLCGVFTILTEVSFEVFKKIRLYLNESLPIYMVPQYLLACNENVLTSTGKMDRNRLLKIFEREKKDPQCFNYAIQHGKGKNIIGIA